MSVHDFIVVGGGPAGMMAAGRAGERGRRVLLLERGPSLGRKLLLTGNGRCNVTNAAPLEEHVRAFGRQGGFLRPALSAFGPEDLRAWLRGRGVETFEESKRRIFPAAGGARSVWVALTGYLDSAGVEVRCGERATSLMIEGDAVAGVEAGRTRHEAGRVLVATGGLSYPSTGSTGDGYRLARPAGHTIAAAYAAVAPLELSEQWPKLLQGTPLRGARVQALDGRGRVVAKADGDAVWTHYGISGPAVHDVSAAIARLLLKGDAAGLRIDMAPDVTEEELAAELRLAAARTGARSIESVLSDRAPHRTARALLQLAGIDPGRRMAGVGRRECIAVAGLLKRLRLCVSGVRPVAEAIVTGGGVSLAEVDAERMESRRVAGLHFAGEVLDLQGPTGGFNLQAAFATGRLAGENA